MNPWNEKWPELRRFDVCQLPLATDTQWTNEGWPVSIVMLIDANDGGYTSADIWSYSEPYDEASGATNEEAARVTRHATMEFAQRLRELMA